MQGGWAGAGAAHAAAPPRPPLVFFLWHPRNEAIPYTRLLPRQPHVGRDIVKHHWPDQVGLPLEGPRAQRGALGLGVAHLRPGVQEHTVENWIRGRDGEVGKLMPANRGCGPASHQRRRSSSTTAQQAAAAAAWAGGLPRNQTPHIWREQH